MFPPLTASSGLTNIAFAAALQLGDSNSCVDLLLSTDRAPEAALFARTFAPSQTPRAVHAWRKVLEGAKKPKQAAALADPEEQPEEFVEGWEGALERERNPVPAELIELDDEEGAPQEAVYVERELEEEEGGTPTLTLNGLHLGEESLVDAGLRESLFLSLPPLCSRGQCGLTLSAVPLLQRNR